jgi:hypothetical protein
VYRDCGSRPSGVHPSRKNKVSPSDSSDPLAGDARPLGEGVTLIDTPGLDDTERFRVQLSEKQPE